MSRLAFILPVALAACRGEEPIPPGVAGVWATQGAEFHGKDIVVKGGALYLLEDGRGSMMGGPPPLGYRVQCRYDAASATLHVRFLGDGPPPPVALKHDPLRRTLAGWGTDTLHRRSERVSPDEWNAVGLEADDR